MHGGILSIGRAAVAFLWGVVRVYPVVLASFFYFEARVFERRFEKWGIPAL
jgi:hypothetical protein